MKNKVLVVVAHPDDEVLGCGGTIARYSRLKAEVHVLILADGVTSRDKEYMPEKWMNEKKARRKFAHVAGRILGVRSLTLLEYPDNRLDTIDRLDLVKSIEKKIKDVKPNIILTHHAGDVNIDHLCVHQAVIAAARPVPGQCVNTILFFEVPSSTEWQTLGSGAPFVPNWFVDISDFLKIKAKALNAYREEMRSWPHPRSYKAIEHLARWRGATVGCQAAEAFLLGRTLQA